MDKFRVALGGRFVKPDGEPIYPDFDLSPLDEEPAIEYAFVPAEGTVPAADVAGFDALILLGARFARESFPADGRLALIARFGVGYDSVDLAACADNSVALVIAPDGVRRPVAVAALTLMLALTGRLRQKDRLARGGPEGWGRRSEFMGRGLLGRTLGSVGLGNIGAELFRLARPLGMSFIAHDPYVDPAVPESLGVRMLDLDELCREADVLAINCLLDEHTRNLIDARRLALMKPTAYLINTARGPIVDQRALTEALAEGRIAGAGLDVLSEEPPDANEPLLALDNVVLSPHALAHTDQCMAGIGAADVAAVLAVMRGRPPEAIVNRDILEDAGWRAKLDAYRSRFGGQ